MDHLIVDQDAVPTLVEVKRASNPEIRRTIVGQMLEYAAHAAVTWTKDELRRSFEQSSRDQDRDPDQVLGELLGPDEDVDTDRFWDEVACNLAANRLRLLFVADGIPEPLERGRRVSERADARDRGPRGGGEAVPGLRRPRRWCRASSEGRRHPLPPARRRD